MNKKKLILFMPSIEGGGVEKNFFIITNFLSKKIKNVSVITTFKNNRKKFHRNVNLIIPQYEFWERCTRRIKYYICLFLLLREIIYNRNLLVFAFQANIYCIIICKLFGISIITRSNTAPDGWSNNIIKKLLYKFFLKKADRVVVNSYEFKRRMKNFFSIDSECIYNPLNKNEIIKLSKIKVSKIFSKNKKLKIINIGRIVDQKDQITLLKALNLIKKKIDFEAIILGRGILKNSLIDYISENGLDKNIKLINFQTNPYKFLKQSEIFILTSKFEGLPNVLLESIVLNKFIISSNCATGPKEILLNGKGGLLFKVGDFQDLAKKIIFYSKNKKKCKKMLHKSIKSINRFDYNRNLEKYFKLINYFL